MAFLQIKSTNPYFSYLIKKNPASGLVAKVLRKGVIFGYYSMPEGEYQLPPSIDIDLITQPLEKKNYTDIGQTYNVYFRDAFNDISYPEYKDQEFEYVNATRFSSAQFILNALADLLRDAFRKRDPEHDPDDEYETTLFCNMVRLDSQRTLTAFTKNFSEVCDIKAEEVAHKYYQITITTKKSLYYLINLTNLFSAFTVIRNKSEYLFLDETTIEKYLGALSVIDPPYFIRYNFKVELLDPQKGGNKTFKKYKTLLETSSHYPIKMVQGDTVQMRMDAIENELGFSHHIVDVGCGEGRYIWPFTRKMLKGKNYYAIDTNEECRNSVARKIRLREITNAYVFDSVDSFIEDTLTAEKFDFVLGEVIEHMSFEEATQLVIKCLGLRYLNSLILTTPNADFNQYYFDDKDMRHPDHKFEFTEEEFKTWIEKIKDHFRSVVLAPMPFTRLQLDVKYLEIGDKVDGRPVTLGAVFSVARSVEQ
jgi:hypothetical protein